MTAEPAGEYIPVPLPEKPERLLRAVGGLATELYQGKTEHDNAERAGTRRSPDQQTMKNYDQSTWSTQPYRPLHFTEERTLSYRTVDVAKQGVPNDVPQSWLLRQNIF